MVPTCCLLSHVTFLLLVAASAVSLNPEFGGDSFSYPDWIATQRAACDCKVTLDENTGRSVHCSSNGVQVDWESASEITFCVAKLWLLEHMPEFDLHFLPPSISVSGGSMLEDNIAFALMALNESELSPKPPIKVQLSYILPYASYHEARVNWRPIFFHNYFTPVAAFKSSNEIVSSLLNKSGDSYHLNWSSRYMLHWKSSTNPPVQSPFEFLAYGYGSCTAHATFLTYALRSVGVPAREAGSPCWNTIQFAGLATENENVTQCWVGSSKSGKVGGIYLNNHNWVEYWNNEINSWSIADSSADGDVVPLLNSWFCSNFTTAGGCGCSSPAGKAMLDHPILATTWNHVNDVSDDGGEILDVSKLKLSNNDSATPLVWSSDLVSPLGKKLANKDLMMVNRTDVYRCKTELSMRI